MENCAITRLIRRVFEVMGGRGAPTIAKRDARVSSVVSPKRQREGLPVTDVLPPEVRRGRMGDKCWPRDQSITESDEGQKDEDEGARGGWRGEEKEEWCVVTLRIEFRIAAAGRFLCGAAAMRAISRLDSEPDEFLVGPAVRTRERPFKFLLEQSDLFLDRARGKFPGRFFFFPNCY